jgi:stalled ribosome alternative rescue factor ArfA
MKYFLIKYRLQNAPAEAWHRDIAEFIAALDGDPALQGKISYRCMKSRDGSDYYHLAGAADDEAVKALQKSPFFSRYTEKTKHAAGRSVDVLPLEIIAETRKR